MRDPPHGAESVTATGHLPIMNMKGAFGNTRSHCACSLDAVHRPSSLRILGTADQCAIARRQKHSGREKHIDREQSSSVSAAFVGHHRASEGSHRCRWRRPSSAVVESSETLGTLRRPWRLSCRSILFPHVSRTLLSGCQALMQVDLAAACMASACSV